MRLPLRLLGRRLPRRCGRLRVGGLDAELTIRRDGWGIPHVDAASEADAWFGLGFCHAQDRPFQLEMLLRVGRGTLAELVGVGGLPADRMSRRLGFSRLAAAQLALLDPAVRAAAEAYAAGISAGHQHGLPRRPHELALLRADPTPWAATDVLAFATLQSFALSANWDAELARLKLLSTDGPRAVLDLDPGHHADLPLSVPVGAAAGPAIDRVASDLAAFAAAAPSGGGSNAWAIAGSRTASGKPLLANDPHLAPRLPAPWYLAHLRCPQWEVAGVSFVGAPALPIAHNGHAAWGITAGLTDQADLFVEEIGPDGASVREAGGFAPCEVRTELIEVRRGEPIEERVLVTPRGPVISPFLEDAPATLSLSAVWLRPLPIRGFLDCLRAHDFEAFRQSFADWPGPALNVVYADAGGRIGYQLVGQLPLRGRGHGTMPLPAWLPDAGWRPELVPFADMPWLADPPQGYLSTANNQPAAPGTQPYLGHDWTEGYRQARILQELGSREDWDAAACARLQMDVTSLPWRELRPIVTSLPVDDADGRRGLELLTAWDGQVGADSAAASVFELWLSELSQRVAHARAPNGWHWALGAGFGPIVPLTMLHTRAPGRIVRMLCDQPDGWFEHGWPAEAAAALSASVRRLTDECGTDVSAWAWGRLRTLTLRHAVGEQPLLAASFNVGPLPFPGDSNTPLQAASGPLQPFANPGFLPNTRAVIDLADPDASRWILAGGQSGNPCSPHYRDMVPRWLDGEAVPIPYSRNRVLAATVHTLTLEPEA